jgi:hypothetical protein
VLAEVEAGRPVLVLLNLGLPARPVWHYAVVVGFDPARNRLLLHSGRRAATSHRAPSWLRRWEWAGRWAVVLQRPDEWPATADRDRLLHALAAFEETADPALAHRAWRTAAEQWPTEPIAWLGLGNTAIGDGDASAAVVAYRQALTLAPDHLAARINLALPLDESAAPCDALIALGEAPESAHPLSPTFLEQRARLVDRCPAPHRDGAPRGTE